MIFLPIKPKFAHAIHVGKKKVEFRKVKLNKDKEKYCIVYASSPKKRIIGYFEIDDFDIDEPNKIWKKYSHEGGVSRKEFLNYYAGTKTAVVFKIKEYFPLDEIDPKEKIKSFSIPQSFCYLNTKQVRDLFSGTNMDKVPMIYL